MPTVVTEAQALIQGDRAAAGRLAANLLQPLRDNFVARPWGGWTLREFKRLDGGADPGARIGEAFEIAADDMDMEAREHPSRIALADGSELSLPALLEQYAETLLGMEFVQRYGRRFPLLPKTLDIAELLSVQGHPEGNTEAYVILAAEEGATIRLGFAADVDASALGARLAGGRLEQQRLLDLCGGTAAAGALQTLLKPWFAERAAPLDVLEGPVRALLREPLRWPEAAGVLGGLRRLYWDVLDLMNAIPVRAGQVIYNANPPRIVAASGKRASAEVHALGNPEGREVLALEVRLPGPTLRAWDNVRFPVREIDIAGALAALNLRRTAPEEFIVAPRPVPGRPGVSRSVDSEYFRLEHLEPTALAAIEVPAAAPHCLHALAGAVSVYATDGAVAGRLARGESALVPLAVGAYRVVADSEPAALLKVDLPPYGS